MAANDDDKKRDACIFSASASSLKEEPRGEGAFEELKAYLQIERVALRPGRRKGCKGARREVSVASSRMTFLKSDTRVFDSRSSNKWMMLLESARQLHVARRHVPRQSFDFLLRWRQSFYTRPL